MARRVPLLVGFASIFAVLGCGKEDPVEEDPMQEGLSPSARCTRYLECASSAAPSTLGPLLEAYGWGGTCWHSTQEAADLCSDACLDGLRQLQELAPDDPACVQPKPEPETGSDVVTEREVDLLLVVDNSGSMGPKQATLARAMDALVLGFANASPPVDVRVAVTTTDNGNPWCTSTTPEAGSLTTNSCRERLESFVFNGANAIDARNQACLDVCARESLGLPDPWIEVTAVGPAEAGEQLRCLVPQGIDGCGLEQPLESMRKSIVRSLDNGFHRPGARLAVILVTDEADCSYNSDHESIFLPEGHRTFWSDPEASGPSSAVCWNAGVRCSGDPGSLSCTTADLTPEGELAANPPEDASLHPISRYIEQLEEHGALVMAIDGVALDGRVRYSVMQEPFFDLDYGVDPGCINESEYEYEFGIPPVRMRAVIEAVSGPGHEASICASSYGPAMTEFVTRIIETLPQ